MPPLLTRRSFTLGFAAGPLGSRAALARTTAWRISQSVALTGPLGDLGQAMHQGAKACFAAVNTRGGVHGRPIELVVLDDGYDVKRALSNLQSFLDGSSSISL